MQNSIQLISEQEVFEHKFNIYGTLLEPLFVAGDVAEWLGHSNVSMMINILDEDEKIKVYDQNVIDGNRNGGRGVWMLTEAGVYEILMLSRKPIAKKFKKKVKEILKKLRLDGSVTVSNNTAIVLPDFTNPVEAARAWANQFEEKQKALQIAAKANDKVIELQPKADYVDEVSRGENVITLTEAARRLKIKRKDLIEYLYIYHYIFRKNGILVPYAIHIQDGMFAEKEYCYSQYKNGEGATVRKTASQLVVTTNGMVKLLALCKKWGLIDETSISKDN